MGPGADGRWRPEAPNAPSTENFFREIFVSRCVSLVPAVSRWHSLGTAEYHFRPGTLSHPGSTVAGHGFRRPRHARSPRAPREAPPARRLLGPRRSLRLVPPPDPAPGLRRLRSRRRGDRDLLELLAPRRRRPQGLRFALRGALRSTGGIPATSSGPGSRAARESTRRLPCTRPCSSP